jgi:hypothetical protein
VSRTAAFSSAILVAKAFGGPIETAYDPIVGLDDDIGQR